MVFKTKLVIPGQAGIQSIPHRRNGGKIKKPFDDAIEGLHNNEISRIFPVRLIFGDSRQLRDQPQHYYRSHLFRNMP